MLKKTVVGCVILSYKSQVLSSFLAFVVPTSIMKHLNVRFFCWQMLQKNGRWVRYTFLQKPSSFQFLSILEENCGADINNETFKCKTFGDKCCKKLLLGALYFPTKATFFQVIQHSSCVFKKIAENCNNQMWNSRQKNQDMLLPGCKNQFNFRASKNQLNWRIISRNFGFLCGRFEFGKKATF